MKPLASILQRLAGLSWSTHALPLMRDRGARIVGLLLAMAVTGSGIVLGLSFLFLLNDDPIPDELAVLVLPAGMAFILCLPLLLRQIYWTGAAHTLLQPGLWRAERKWRRREKERQALEHARILRLASDPGTARYAAALRRGEYWSDEAIEYDRDPALLVTDAAIRSIEQAMREAGISLRRGLGATLTAHCRIDQTRLYAQFPPGGRYHYTDDFHFDRPHDPGEAVIISTAGTSYIHVTHPRAGKEAPIFPPLIDARHCPETSRE